MIHSFAVENFGPFKDEVILDFTVTSQTDNDFRFFNSESGTRLTKALVIFGPNGSGKTRLLQAFSFFRWFATSSFSALEHGKKIPVFPFRFRDDAEEYATKFTIKFEFLGEIYKYRIELTRETVIYECLTKKPLDGTNWPYVFKWEPKKRPEPRFKDDNWDVPGSLPGDRVNCSFLSCLLAMGYPPAITIQEILDGFDNLGPRGRYSYSNELFRTTENYSVEPELLDTVVSIMNDFDIPLVGVDIRNAKIIEDGEEREIKFPIAQYMVNGIKRSLPMIEESDGTKCLYSYLGDILVTLENGGVIVLDELDQDMHPRLVEALFKILTDPSFNDSDAQSITSTHCTELMNRLHKQQIVFTERESTSMTSKAWKLSSIRGVSNQENYQRKYLAGAYGALPSS